MIQSIDTELSEAYRRGQRAGVNSQIKDNPYPKPNGNSSLTAWHEWNRGWLSGRPMSQQEREMLSGTGIPKRQNARLAPAAPKKPQARASGALAAAKRRKAH